MSSETYPNTWRFLKGRVRDSMSRNEKSVMEDLVQDVCQLGHGEKILTRGSVTQRSTFLIEGFVARVNERDGKRQIISIHVPGDFVDLHSYALKKIDHDLMTFGTARVGYVSHVNLDVVMTREPKLARHLWFASHLDAAIHREWIAKLQSLSADGCLAHLITEVHARLKAVAAIEHNSFAFPLTQTELAETCGTTPVHMNRVVRKLREQGLADISRKKITILDAEGLAALAQFDMGYLYQNLPEPVRA
ncbi:Crp/Fnr family transcriptional regulator [Thioclava sp. GXIMD2076]|uniref:Crp/Fnr family transcriptional regulator n=1 Tax=Thioclava kandeliae TaxID=3070818 RepID=A0ABV1SEJ9_9RHOB